MDIETSTTENNRSSALHNMLGVCRSFQKGKSERDVKLALNDFKAAFYKDNFGQISLEALCNHVKLCGEMGRKESDLVNNFLKTLITIIDDLVLSFTCKRVILGGAILNSLKSILTSEKILNFFSSRINPKYSQLIEEVQVDLLMEDEPGIYGCLAFLKTK